MPPSRGRKRDETLSPNRARDNSRAFRARQCAHLQALEQRILELETENKALRQAHGYPPSSRPPLGTGPTGLQSPSYTRINSSPCWRGISSMQPIDRRRNNPQLMQVPNQHSDSAECGISLRHHCHNLLSSDVRFYSSNYLSNIWSLDRAIGLDGHRGDYNLPPQGPGEIHVSDSEIPQQNLNANTSPHQLNANPLIENTIPSYFES